MTRSLTLKGLDIHVLFFIYTEMYLLFLYFFVGTVLQCYSVTQYYVVSFCFVSFCFLFPFIRRNVWSTIVVQITNKSFNSMTVKNGSWYYK